MRAFVGSGVAGFVALDHAVLSHCISSSGLYSHLGTAFHNGRHALLRREERRREAARYTAAQEDARRRAAAAVAAAAGGWWAGVAGAVSGALGDAMDAARGRSPAGEDAPGVEVRCSSFKTCRHEGVRSSVG